ncbi:hypothetical protein SAMN04488058_11040 [Deinococcus reticulitermitis]|uniref:Uncharacterized protein n=1 Tax=Deinococcus reticulitermitis TaxID=856736 RepID=A0A1H6ZKC7_9DEIO|nr:hypothetical protein [Deinococcus reticulitermitis]SEJ53879.1 hypothetical protein SAMN04488058_11040 [Deinococcus reticulitermitis]
MLLAALIFLFTLTLVIWQFRRVRDEIDAKITTWLTTQGAPAQPSPATLGDPS